MPDRVVIAMTVDHESSWDGFFTALSVGNMRHAANVFAAMVAAARSNSLSSAEPMLTVKPTLESEDNPGEPTILCWHISGPEPEAQMEFRLQLDNLSGHDTHLRVASEGDLQALGVTAFALAAACRGRAGERWYPHEVDDVPQPTAAELEQQLSGFRILARDDRIEELLRAGRDVFMYGNVGSGKTTTAVREAMHYTDEDASVVWLDLTDPHDCDESVAYALLRMRRRRQILLVIDNVQANVSAARGIFDLVVKLRRDLAIPLVVLATGSPVLTAVEPPLCSTYLEPVLADGHALVRSMLHGDELLAQAHDVKAQIAELADGDGFLAEMALRLWRERREVPGRDEFADFVLEQFHVDDLSPQARRLLYEIACLSACEIQVGKNQVALLPPERSELTVLLDAKLIQLVDESYSIRHRSLARLLVVHGLRQWTGETPLPNPAVFAYDYLQRAGSAQIKATLDKLDLLPLDRESSQPSATGLASAWRALSLLGESLAHRVREDPTWGDEVASAVFAGTALAKLGQLDAWQMSADYVRGRWLYVRDDELPSWTGEPSADLKTFEKMRDLVKDQPGLTVGVGMGADLEIDAERACRTWMLGLLLYFEALAPVRDWARIDRLRNIAIHEIDGGAFYPSEAPWVTAQVIQGLCLAGLSYSHPTVKSACDWLCQDKRVGGAYQAGWQNVVSVSTFDATTTALCFLALWQARCHNHELLEVPYQKLRDEQSRLMTGPHHETELALIVAARLRRNDWWADLSGPILSLLGWIKNERWRSRSIKASQPGDPVSASAKLPFITSQLWIIIWAAAKQELPNLLKQVLRLDDLGLPEGPWPPTDPSRSAVLRQREIATSGTVLQGVEEKRKLERLRKKVEETLNELAGPSRTLRLDSGRATVNSDIEQWQQKRDYLTSIEAEFDSGIASQETIRRLDGLGIELFGNTW